MDLTVCVIGRNEAENLNDLFQSLVPLRDTELAISFEVIYIDSASSDNSVQCAERHADRVYVLESSEHLSAAAGRYFGALNSRGKWILFLDGDMELSEEFIPIIADALFEKDRTVCGYVGDYTHVYDNGGTVRRGFPHVGRKVTYFGGAVLLRRSSLLEVGNWNPRLYSHEEVELYTRLRGSGYWVEYVPVPMVVHKTEHVPRSQTLKAYLSLGRRSGLGKRFYGPGQIVASRFRQGNLANYARYYPYPFIWLVCSVLALMSIAVGQYWAFPFLLGLGAYLVTRRTRGLHFVFLYTVFWVQVVLGWHAYNHEYEPKSQCHVVRTERKNA